MDRDDSILQQMEARGLAAPRVDLEGGLRRGPAFARYEVVSEIARGAFSEVYRGRDNDIGREVALKVLREEHLGSPEIMRRFIEEAQIGGQLQHPGILPVYEIGMREDGRPFFATRLVKGETLEARLARRSDPSEDQRTLLTAFREACRAIAYAHVHEVLHGDLTPAHVMLGNFGDVLVVDWGSARVLKHGRRGEQASAGITLISTVGTRDSSGSGHVAPTDSTPGYAAPEQVLGFEKDIDEKSDIFSLGSILTEILTGEPAYAGSPEERRAAARRANVDEAVKRLARCGVDERLIKVCQQCIQPLSKDRPRSVQVLADAVAAGLAASEAHAHRARLNALKAEARAEEQRRSRRQTARVASVVVGAVLLGTGLFLWIDGDSSARERERRAAIDTNLGEATRLASAGKWEEAVAAAQRAVELGGDQAQRAQILAERQRSESAAQSMRSDRVLLATLEEPRELYGLRHLLQDEADGETEDEDGAFDKTYDECFKGRFGGLLAGRDALAASSLSKEFAACLGYWSSLRRESPSLRSAGWKSLHSLAVAVDPSVEKPREALAEAEVSDVAAATGRLGENVPATLVTEAGLRLTRSGRAKDAARLLGTWQVQRPGDYWLNVELARALLLSGEPQQAARHAFAAVAVRPTSAVAWIRLALYYTEAGFLVDADYALRRAQELEADPDQLAAGRGAVERARLDREAAGR